MAIAPGTTNGQDEELFRNSDGIFVPLVPVRHADDAYDQHGLEILRSMQRDHFWYRHRRAFLLCALKQELRRRSTANLSAVDLGGGCGGWVEYLCHGSPVRFGELALADSSLAALRAAGPLVLSSVKRFQVDATRLEWRERWDIVFMLDVLEHLSDQAGVMRCVSRAVRRGGSLFVTAPAFPGLWSYNDELALHRRRYCRGDFRQLAADSGMQLVKTRYFMFLLTPFAWLRRWRRCDIANMTAEQKLSLARRTHRTPPTVLNRTLTCLLSSEIPLGVRFPLLPWGSSVLAVFRKR
jgi:SAM-dependent methyltransferase